MHEHIFRALENWRGAATVVSVGRSYLLAYVFVTVFGLFDAAEDGSETDTGERMWSARASLLDAAVEGEVTLTLEGGEPTQARVAYRGALLGDGVPSPLGERSAVTRPP